MPDRARSQALDPDAFWAFSLEFYARPGIAEHCLQLQDRDGFDVNILLLCCWLGAAGHGRLTRAEVEAAETHVAAWRQAIVERMRAVRRALKTMPGEGAASLRAEVQRLELAAEREAQRLLLAGLPRLGQPSPDPLADTSANLATYLQAGSRSEALIAPFLAALRRWRP